MLQDVDEKQKRNRMKSPFCPGSWTTVLGRTTNVTYSRNRKFIQSVMPCYLISLIPSVELTPTVTINRASKQPNSNCSLEEVSQWLRSGYRWLQPGHDRVPSDYEIKSSFIPWMYT